MVILETTEGPIQLVLDTQVTLQTAQNFLNYVKEGFYEGTLFHRVIEGFMIQGGGFTSGMERKEAHEPIKNEASLPGARKNTRGTIAMARTSDPHSATAQFFINLVDNTFLDFKSETPEGWGYCVFGWVEEGMDVVDRIAKVTTGYRAGHQDVPDKEVKILRVFLAENP